MCLGLAVGAGGLGAVSQAQPVPTAAPTGAAQDACASVSIVGKDPGLPDDQPPPAASERARQSLAARYKRRAQLYGECRDLQGAVRAFGLARTLDPDDREAIAGLADAYLASGDYRDAAPAYTDLISRSQGGAPFGGLRAAHANRALALMSLGRREEELADLDLAIDKLGGPLPAPLTALKSERARALLKLGRSGEAAVEYQALADAGVATADDLYGLGLARLQTKDYAAAVIALGHAELKLDDSPPGERAERAQIDLALAQAYQARAVADDARNARDLYLRVLAEAPDNRDAAARLAALPAPPPRPSFQEPQWAALELPAGVADPERDLPPGFCSQAERNAYLDRITGLSAVVNDDITLAARYSTSLLQTRVTYDQSQLLRYSEKIDDLSLFDAELTRLLAVHKALARRGEALLGLFAKVRDDQALLGHCPGAGAAATGAARSPLELAGLAPLAPPPTAAAPQPASGAAQASAPEPASPTPSVQAAQTSPAAPPAAPPATSIYAVESQIRFNVLDSVFFDPSTGDLALVGHRDERFKGDSIPYLQYLATLLESPKPEFSLEWTPDSLARVDAMLKRELSQSESDAQATRLAAMVDGSGLVTHTGALMLPALGVYPIDEGRAPGDLGVEVANWSNARVIITKVAPGSAADKAGLKPMDLIVSVRSGRPAYFDAELKRQVRFAGAGAAIEVRYERNGQSQTAQAKLDAATETDPWQGVDRYDLLALMYRGAGDRDAANVVQAMGVLNSASTGQVGSAAPTAVGELMQALGAQAQFQRVQAAAANGAVPYQDSYDLGLKVSQQLDAIFHFAGGPLQALYEAKVGATHEPAGAISAVFNGFGDQLTPKVGELLDRLLYRPGVGFQVPPELVESEYQTHPEMTPKYLGVPADSQLARLMLAGDYLGKQLANRQDLKDRIPGYMTQVEYQMTHAGAERPGGSAWRVWLTVAGVDAAQSADGRTLALKGARMRYNVRETDDAAHDLPNQAPNGYEDVLTGLYDQFEQRFATLHEVREAAKLAAVAQWMGSHSPGVRLPGDGRTAWTGPEKVDGLVYIYLTTDQQRQPKIIKIAEGGLSLVLPAGAPYPTDASVVDLRGTLAGGSAFTAPAPAAAASPSWTSWVAPLGDDGRQAVVVRSGPPARPSAPAATLASDSRTGLFGSAEAPAAPDLGGPRTATVTVRSAGEQLASAAQSGEAAKAGALGLAGAPDTPRSAEAIRERAACAFDNAGCAAPVNAPQAPTQPPPQTRALMRKVGAAGDDAVIRNSIAWYQKLELRQADTQAKLDAVQARIDKNDGDPAVLVAQKATLQNDLSQNTGDQAAVLAQVKARMVDLGVPWTDAPAPAQQPTTTAPAPAGGAPPSPSPAEAKP